MKAYLTLLRHVLAHGEQRPDRTGVGTRSVFAPPPLRMTIGNNVPLLTTKRMSIKPLLTELEWFLRDDSNNTAYLHDRGVKLWDSWAAPDGYVGPIYGHQWRRWDGVIDQLGDVVLELRANPTSRRLVVSAWNVSDLPEMALPPCPVLFQFYARAHGLLDCHVYQRSADIFLGVPFDIAQYAILLAIVAKSTGYTPGDLTFSFGDLHLYNNHVDQAELQLTREPRDMPKLDLAPDTSIDTFTADRVRIYNYNPHPAITGKVAV